MPQFFHFQITRGDKILLSSQDKKGFKGFTHKLTAKTIALEELGKEPHATSACIYCTSYDFLPLDHPAIQLMSDLQMTHEGEYDENDYSKLHK